jgi:tRNA threonylcarbamoyladenosine biosynthesis protein TsaE
VIELCGDLGSGKTTLVQGVLQGLGYKCDVPSPTFTLTRSYAVSPSLTFHHFDLYRLGGHDIVSDELAAAAGQPEAVVAVEWAGHGAADLPTDHLAITLASAADPAIRQVGLESRGPRSRALLERVQHDYRA